MTAVDGTIRKRLGPADDAIGIRMRDLFDIARSATAMPFDEVQRLLADPRYEARMAAFCILDFRAKAAGTSPAERKHLYDLYLGHHDRITTWDMVDRAAPSVVGGHLLGRSRETPVRAGRQQGHDSCPDTPVVMFGPRSRTRK